MGGFFTKRIFQRRLCEGSFDKGLFLDSFNGLLPGNTKNAYSTIVRPLDRDGGRRLKILADAMALEAKLWL